MTNFESLRFKKWNLKSAFTAAGPGLEFALHATGLRYTGRPFAASVETRLTPVGNPSPTQGERFFCQAYDLEIDRHLRLSIREAARKKQ